MAEYPALTSLLQDRVYPFVQQLAGVIGLGNIEECARLEKSNSISNRNSETSSANQGNKQNNDTNAVSSSSNNSILHRVLSLESGSNRDEDDVTLADDADCSTDEKLGRLQFSLTYDERSSTLTLKIIRAEQLPAKDLSGTSDPYVKIMLLPDKKNKLTTKVKRKNLNPRWNELFAFEGFPYSKLINRTLYLQVLDYDRFSRDDPIGEIFIPLSDFDFTSKQTIWRTLQPCQGHTGKLGELLLSLCYQPSVGVISVGIVEARNLKAKDINGLSDPYVKVWLMHDGKRVEKKKTEIKEKTLNPVYNDTLMFNVPYERIRQTSLIVSVVDYDRMGRNEPIGQVLLGTKSSTFEMKHWNEMFAKSRQEVVKWHLLKDFG